MKRLGLFLIAVVFIAAVSGGCDNFKGEDGQIITANEFNKNGTLQGFLYSALTGEPISYTTEGENLVKVRLQEGTNTRNPNKLITDIADPLVGLYVFNDVPFNLYVGNITYPIIVTVPGYQKFVGNIAPNAIVTAAAAGTITNAGEWSNFVDSDVLLDANYHGLANIYLFPVGATSGDITVTVVDPLGRNVPGVTVRLQQNIAGNVPIAELGNRLLAVAGYMTSFSAITDSTGTATFSETTLVLGGSYTPTTDPITYTGQELAGIAGAAFIVGTADVHIQLLPANLDAALYVATASNEVPGSVTASGVLTLTFNHDVSLNFGLVNDSTQFAGGLTGLAAGDTTVVASVVTTVSGGTITITPTFTPTTGPTTAGAVITYTHAGVLYDKATQVAAGGMGGAGGTFTVANKLGVATSSVVQILVQ